MRRLRFLLVGSIGLAFGVPAAASAQAPVAVPIVGSPAPQPPPAPVTAPPIVQAAPPAPAGQPPAARSTVKKLDLAFTDGTVALDAQNVTLREILTEWQRRGGCTFVNLDKIPGIQISRQFPAGTSELKALDSLLRDLGTPTSGYGYMVGPAAEPRPGMSMFKAVYILASSRPSASAAYAPSASSPLAAPLITVGSPEDEIPPVSMPPPPAAQPRAPVPQQGQPNQGSQNPAPAGPSFGPVAPTAPGAGGMNQQPQTPPGGRGGNQPR